jgi:iron complex transport system substrate-binding protein
MMRFLAFAAAVIFAFCGVISAANAKPRHIMSINMCTDELLLDLVPADRIASVTFFSRERSDSYLWPEAARVPINHGQAEEALVEQPDFVLAGSYTTTATRAVLKGLGTPMMEVPPANNFEEIRTITRAVAHALGEDARGDALIAKTDGTLRFLSATRPQRAIRVAGWGGGGSVPGKGTLFDAILTAAGGVNIAATMKGARYGSFDIEELLLAQPDLLAYGADNDGTPGLRTDVDQHPLILKLYGRRRITYPETLYSCGAPESADAARILRASMLNAMRAARGSL